MSSSNDRVPLIRYSRRDVLGGVAGGLTILASRRARAQEFAVVETALGTWRGRNVGSICVFKGIRYGETTGGSNRFRPPQPMRPWAGVRDALEFGPAAPQTSPPGVVGTDRAQVQDEDCLCLNIWTPGTDGSRRPVMVWLHGGGFTGGAGDAPQFDGTRLALHQEVVIVTMNHRLGVLGFLYLDDISAGAERCANLGLLDVAAALRWVQTNIQAFGGDPNRVTLFGESGGARKVATFSAMPIGRGLYQRLIVQSGPATRQLTPARATVYTHAFLRAVGARAELPELQKLPLAQILKAQAAVQPGPDMPLDNVITGFAPVVDGESLPADAYSPRAPAVSADVPMIIGSNRWEQTSMDRDPPIWDRRLTQAALRARLQALMGRQTDSVLRVYRRRYRDLNPAELFLRIDTDRSYWINSVRIAERRAAERRAPTFVYRLEWQTPVMEGKLKTPHGLDVPLVFDTVESQRHLVGPGAAPQALAHRMSATWAAFARYGDPNHAAIPVWQPYAAPERTTMLISESWAPVSDPDAEARRVLKRVV